MPKTDEWDNELTVPELPVLDASGNAANGGKVKTRTTTYRKWHDEFVASPAGKDHKREMAKMRGEAEAAGKAGFSDDADGPQGEHVL